MNCTNCGKEIEGDAVWAEYADESFQGRGKQLDSFPLHEDCFTAAEHVPHAEWENDDEGASVLVDKGMKLRYRRVEAPV